MRRICVKKSELSLCLLQRSVVLPFIDSGNMMSQPVIGKRVFWVALEASRNPSLEQSLFVELSCQHPVTLTQLEFKSNTLHLITSIYFNATPLRYQAQGDRAVLEAPTPLEGNLQVRMYSDTLKGVKRPLTGTLIGEDGSVWMQTGCNSDYLVRLYYVVN